MSATTTQGLQQERTIEITEDVSVTLPNRFASYVGQPITPDLANIIFAHVAGQFRNNQVANAKSRVKQRAEAKTDEEREKFAPMTADDYLAIWTDYMPNVGGGRQSNMERMRTEAAKRAWAKIVAEHNARIDAGETGLLASDKKTRVEPRPVKTKAVSTEAHEANVADWQARQDKIYAKLLENSKYADFVQREMDALEAEAGKKAEAEMETAGEDLI